MNKDDEIRFQCQRTGFCCCEPSIIVTLTYIDIFRLFQEVAGDFNHFLRVITFYKIDDFEQVNKDKMVVDTLETSEGSVIIGLRKDNGVCYFYQKNICSMYNNRPLACRNYPFAFVREKNKIFFTWAKDATITCKGIGEGEVIPPYETEKLGNNFSRIINTHNNLVDEINSENRMGKSLSAREAVVVLLAFAEKELRK